jgi:PAS domain S-box-containing protein
MISSKGNKRRSDNVKTHQKQASSTTANEIVPGEKGGEGYKNTVDDIFGQVEDYAIMILDDHGIITSWNKGAERIKGYHASEILGKNYRIFYSKEDREKKLSERLLDEARRNGRTSYEGWRVRKDGSRFWGNMTLTALRDEHGKITRFLKITRDLTEKKESEDRLSNFYEELTVKNEELKKSEQRYHKLISEVRDYAIILLDRDGLVMDWNLGAEKLKGYTPAEIIGKSFRLFYPKEEKENRLPERLLAEAAEHGSIIHEGWRIRKNGKRFWGNITITALHDDEGNIIGYSKVTRDLTDKKIAEDKISNVVEELKQSNEMLKRSEERYHRMISEVQDYAIVLLSVNGDVLNWNAGAQFIKGYTPAEIVGKNFRLFYPKEDRENGLPEKLLSEARNEGRVIHEGWRVRKDGTKFWGSVVITALHDVEGGVIGFSKVTRDLTERRNADEALRTSAAQLDLKNKTLERLNAELSSFSYIASHDLKEPLRKIQTFAGKMEHIGGLNVQHQEFLAKISHSAERMQKLIHDLLAYSEVSNGVKAFDKIDLNETVEHVKNDLEIIISEKDAIVEYENLPVIVGIPHQINQIFLNLISNSLKFSKPSVPPVIKIKAKLIKGPKLPGHLASSKNEYYQISFTDNGIGFEEEFAGKIFQAFQRLHSRYEFSGTGIGLAIVKKVVENHSGVVEALGRPGIGSTFNVFLPVNQPA